MNQSHVAPCYLGCSCESETSSSPGSTLSRNLRKGLLCSPAGTPPSTPSCGDKTQLGIYWIFIMLLWSSCVAEPEPAFSILCQTEQMLRREREFGGTLKPRTTDFQECVREEIGREGGGRRRQDAESNPWDSEVQSYKQERVRLFKKGQFPLKSTRQIFLLTLVWCVFIFHNIMEQNGPWLAQQIICKRRLTIMFKSWALSRATCLFVNVDRCFFL